MTGFKIALLDYDGTLAVTRPAVAECFRRTLLDHGETVPTSSRVAAVVASGVALPDAFRRLVPGLPDDRVERCVIRYREHYPEVDRAETVLYDDVPGALRALRDLGVRTVVLSNKGRVAVETALARFQLSDTIDHVLAADPGEPTKPDPDVFHRRVAPLFERSHASDFLMVGDTEADLNFARTVGIRSCWASYGYGDLEGCRALAPDHEIAGFGEIVDLARVA